ncbi:MAG: flavodoxin family protein [Candidatus Woesearchaeota archaeon]
MKILSICGSPRKGNSEAIITKFNEIFDKMGIDNSTILLREKNIGRCDGCVEYCNKHLDCFKKDDMVDVFKKMRLADGFVFVSPNYFKMPPGIFKDFMDRCSVFFTKEYFTKENDLAGKKAVVVCVGTDTVKGIDVCTDNIIRLFVEPLGLIVVAKKSFRSNSELKGNYNDIFENKLNPDIMGEIETVAKKLVECPRS